MFIVTTYISVISLAQTPVVSISTKMERIKVFPFGNQVRASFWVTLRGKRRRLENQLKQPQIAILILSHPFYLSRFDQFKSTNFQVELGITGKNQDCNNLTCF
jgi:hypothetical protein